MMLLLTMVVIQQKGIFDVFENSPKFRSIVMDCVPELPGVWSLNGGVIATNRTAIQRRRYLLLLMLEWRQLDPQNSGIRTSVFKCNQSITRQRERVKWSLQRHSLCDGEKEQGSGGGRRRRRKEEVWADRVDDSIGK